MNDVKGLVELDHAGRRNREREKALAKYGPEALAPGGREEFDVLDYLINEVVGLERYGEMIVNRFGSIDNDHARKLVALGRHLQQMSRSYSRDLIEVRLRMLHELGDLGSVETLPEA